MSRRYYEPRLGYSMHEIREQQRRMWGITTGCSYAQAEVELFRQDNNGEDPTVWDRVKSWWDGREERALARKRYSLPVEGP